MTYTLFLVLIMIVALLLILIIMVQNPKGGGLSSSFGGDTFHCVISPNFIIKFCCSESTRC